MNLNRINLLSQIPMVLEMMMTMNLIVMMEISWSN